MTISVTSRLSDGTVVLRDDEDGYEAVLRADQWERIQALPAAEWRATVIRFVEANTTSGDPRTEVDQQVIQASEQGQGERHEQQEEAQ
jgi:hypothetical protein